MVTLCFHEIEVVQFLALTLSVNSRSDSYELTKTSVVVVTSLPFSGSEMMSFLFVNVSDFLYMSEGDAPVPSASGNPGDEGEAFDVCVWPKQYSQVSSGCKFNYIEVFTPNLTFS